MSKSKKIFISILICIAFLDIGTKSLFAVWDSKIAITIDDLKKVAEQNGYEFVETNFHGEGVQKSGIIILEKDILLEYWWFETNTDAEIKILEEEKGDKKINCKAIVSFGSQDYDKTWTEGGEKQQLLVRVDNTVIISTYDKDKRTSVNHFINQIGY